jgi:hypothetical protein
MTTAAERLITGQPGRMESRPTHGALARCTLHALSPEDLEQTMCDATHDEEATKHIASTDADTFRLYAEFIHAHGIPRGEITTFSNMAAMTVNHERDHRLLAVTGTLHK